LGARCRLKRAGPPGRGAAAEAQAAANAGAAAAAAASPGLQYSRMLRTEQDVAFQQSLEQDRAKEAAAAAAAAAEVRCNPRCCCCGRALPAVGVIRTSGRQAVSGRG
jgi:hypothetical protein